MNRYIELVNPWWESRPFSVGVLRSRYLDDLKKNLNKRFIQVLTGLRRVGKSTITLQLIDEIISENKIEPQKILYFSVEEPSLADLSIIDIINWFRREHNIKTSEKIYVFIDEIQFRDNWQQEIKSLYDSENIKFVLTGSSAMLLSDKLSYLTGRYIKTQIFPLNFKEYLSFKKVRVSATDSHLLNKHLLNYLEDGGLPEYILSKTDRYLETTVESILFKDLVSKFQLRNPKVLMDLIYLLSDRVGSTTSSAKLSNILEINKDTVLTYMDYLTKTYITSDLKNYSSSRNKEIYNPSKIYFDDTGVCSKYSSKINSGALAENALFNCLRLNLEGKLRIKKGYWYEDKNEVDFVVNNGNDVFLFESKWIDKFDEIDLAALKKATKSLKPKRIFLITKDLERIIKTDWGIVEALPLYKFLLADFSKFI